MEIRGGMMKKLLPCALAVLVHGAFADDVAAKSTSNSSSSQRKKYNILFLMCDSMDGRVLDPRSPLSGYLEMPFMWSLAAQGVNFVSTYSNNPQCAPSRISMFTGRHTHQIRAWSNQKPLVATPGSGTRSGKWDLDPVCVKQFDEPLCEQFARQQNVSATFMDTLSENGVAVALYGKVDVGGNLLRRPESVKAWANGFHARALDTVGRAADIRKGTKPRPHPREWVPTKLIYQKDWRTISDCKQWFEENRQAEGPWMLYCSILIPHPPYLCNTDTESHVNESIPLPEWFTHPQDFPESAMHPYDSYMSFSKTMMAEQGGFDGRLLERNMRCWLAMCYQTDQMLGEVWAKAGETGNLENTIVIFLSDHGEMHMEHRQHLKNSLFEGSARVPLVIAGPGSKPRTGSRRAFEGGRLIEDHVSLLDIYPTLVDATGGAPPAFLSGYSLMPYLAGGGGQRPTDYVVSMYMSNMANTNAFMIRQGPWKYITYGRSGPSIYRSYSPQLFNLERDPGELHDVSRSEPATAERLDLLLRSVVDFEAVDREVKLEEKMLYDRYYKSMGKAKLRAEWSRVYSGFDDADAQKVRTWYESLESSPQPVAAREALVI